MFDDLQLSPQCQIRALITVEIAAVGEDLLSSSNFPMSQLGTCTMHPRQYGLVGFLTPVPKLSTSWQRAISPPACSGSGGL